LYYASGTIASDVFDTGTAGETWQTMSWDETLHANTDITFEVRASDTLFTKDASSPAWTSVGGTSPVTSGLPTGRYMQWRATLTTSNNFYTPVLHSVTIGYSSSPEVVTNAATNITSSSATLNGNLTAMGTATTVNVSFQWGTTQGGPYPNSTSAQALTAPGAFSANLSSLTPNTTYYYRAKADGGASGIDYGAEMSFHTSTIPPSVTTNAATSVTTNAATLNGTLTNMGTATTVNVSFQWGTTQGGPYPNSTTPQARTSPGAFQANLSNLGPNTTYYYRTKADGGASGTSYGVEMSFTTLKVPPAVVTDDATNITASSATLNGDLANLGSASTVNVSFQWGTTQGGPYPNSTTPQAMTAAGSFSANLSNLTGNTTYYYRAKGDGGVHGISYGSEISFTTPKVPPSVNTNGATNITSSSANLNGNLTSLGTAPTVNVSFQYGTTSGVYNSSTPPQPLTVPEAFQANLSSLAPNTTYYYRANLI
jgi:subtilisin